VSFLLSSDPNASLTPEAAAQLVLMRRKARVRFEDFMLYWIIATRSPIKWGWHISYLCDIMQAVTEREEEYRFLNINIPPRFLKSTILSQLWQAFMIGCQDDARSSVFSISSSATLAGRDSRRTLDTVRSVWFKALFPRVEIGSKETEAEWETKGGAYRIACGREGTVTGRGAHHLLVDDLVSAQEGDSETVREQANEFLGKTLRSRLDDQRTGTITNIQQRLHERDATGVLNDLAKIPGGDVYKTITLPNEAEHKTVVTIGTKVYAIREQGDLLHPEYLGRRETLAIKASQRRNYDGQYQQRPSKMEGGHLDPRRILRLQGSGIEIKSRLGLTPYFYLDFAGTEKKSQKDDPDFNVIHVLARDQLRRLIHLDIWKKQTADYGMMARTLIKMFELWRPRAVKGEKGALLNVFQPALLTQMRLTGKYLTLTPLPARTADKIERSMGYQAELNAGMVCAPQDAPWFLDYESEARGFPNGAHDDMLEGGWDAANDQMQSGEVPYTSPTDPAVILSDDVKRRIEEAREAQMNPRIDDNDGWG
jgi:predicted phage terminase large subunit-like protein